MAPRARHTADRTIPEAASSSSIRPRHPPQPVPARVADPTAATESAPSHTAASTSPDETPYLVLRERLEIADLRRLGLSIRQISVRLGRHPSTVSRELRRHRTGSGDYLPHLADDDASANAPARNRTASSRMPLFDGLCSGS